MRRLFVSYFCIAISSLIFAQQIPTYDVLRSDLLNINAPGYKSSDISHLLFLNATIDQPGFYYETGVSTDFAILSSGYFKVVNPNSKEAFYTRNGNFHFDSLGFLANKEGYRLYPSVSLDGGAFISISSVSSYFILITKKNNMEVKQEIPIKAYTFSEQNKPGIFFTATDPVEVYIPEVKTGYLENGNTNLQLSFALMKLALLSTREEKKDISLFNKQLSLINRLIDENCIISLPLSVFSNDKKPTVNLDPVFLRDKGIKKVYSAEEWIEIVSSLKL